MVLRAFVLSVLCGLCLACTAQDFSGEVRIECKACTLQGTNAYPSTDITGEYSFRLTIAPGDMVSVRVTQRNTENPDIMSADFLLDGEVGVLAVTGGQDFVVLTLANVTKTK